MTAVAPPEFAADGPLPGVGRVMLRASAGTGKTFALSALATRLVAEGVVPVEQLLVVTYTRAAAAELRDRVRRRLVDAVRFLADPRRWPGEPDPVLRSLLDVDREVQDRRRHRLARAVVDFDTATITTIHGFCTQVLLTLGSVGGHNPDAVLVQDTKELVTAACADALTAVVLDGPGPGTPTKLRAWVAAVLNNPGVHVVARSGREPDLATAELVERAARSVRDRLVGTGSISYDGLLEAVRDALHESPAAAERLAAQFPVALIDEFQDTDPLQWDIFRTIYTEDGVRHRDRTRLVLVGDPKQAIFAFRGGDIHTYLAAAEGADVLTLSTNWRSDGAVLRAMNALCRDWELGDPRIRYEAVRPAPDHESRRLVGPGGGALPAVDVRCVVDVPAAAGASDAVRWSCIDDLVERVADLLDGGARIPGPAGGPERDVVAQDIAVLVHANSWGPPVQRALARVGIPSVITGGSSVADSPAADQWRLLVDALARPADPTRARAVALSWFQDWDAEQVAATVEPGADDLRLARLQARLETWAGVLRTQGVSALVAALRIDTAVAPRVLAEHGGERNLTDLDHLGELLHAATGGRPVGPESLRAALDGLSQTDDDDDPEAIKRRIDTDAPAVRIMTLHASKGLEFPVVCCPSLWNLGASVNQRLFHEDGTEGRLLDVSKDSKDVRAEHDAATAELVGQNHRLTYVGLTRGVHHTIVWWAPAGRSWAKASVASVLFGCPGGDLPRSAEDQADLLEERVQALGLHDELRVGRVDPHAGRPRRRVPSRPTGAPDAGGPDAGDSAAVSGELQVATLGRELDRSAGRWSFTAITGRAVEEDAVTAAPPSATGSAAGTDPDDPSLGDAADGDEQQPPPPVLFDGLGAGAAFGTLVHEVLEHLDFTADLETELTAHLEARPWATAAPERLPALVTALAAAVRTPLGDAFGGRPLASLGRGDRLDELDFELPLGVDAAGRTVGTTDLGWVLVEHLPDGDPVLPWARRLADGMIDVDLGGHLTGSIDLVLRLPRPGVAGGHRFSVVDYKTNRLGTWGVPDVIANYHPDVLPAAMADHHYPLQAVLYSVALHRYLRWRLPGYSPEDHLGPVGYLFVRGMVGPGTPGPGGRTHGVFAWTPPPAAVVALSDRLHGVTP